MSRVLIVLALVCAIIATLLGFEVVTTSGDPHVLGWLSLAFAIYVADDLIP